MKQNMVYSIFVLFAISYYINQTLKIILLLGVLRRGIELLVIVVNITLADAYFPVTSQKHYWPSMNSSYASIMCI